MLFLTTFILICLAAVFFLLRFLFALDSEIRAGHKRAKTGVDLRTTYQTPSTTRVSNVAPVLTARRAS
jgi:hypothetical protein